MSFISIKFLLFFLSFFYLYWFFSRGVASKKLLLVLASSLFYSFFSLSFLFHFYFILLGNYFLYKLTINKKYYITYVVVLNLANLILFKYFYFISAQIGYLTGIHQLAEKPALDQYISNLIGVSGFEIALPATISYYSFQLISFAFDTKNGKIDSAVPILDFLVYCLFFPIMVAGPILRYTEFLNQFKTIEPDRDVLFRGISLILLGIFKKLILSDNLTPIIYPVFGNPIEYSGSALLLTTYFFGFHLYLDFSGLTDLARGMGLLLGFQLPENFKAPFFMTGFGDFWRRWHLTFSFWIRDYIYIPLGGSRHGDFRTSINFVITFALGGLWHGASLNFALWGIINGSYVALERIYQSKNIKIFPDFKGKLFLYFLFVLHLDIITWILFFTKDISTAFLTIQRILTLQSGQKLQYAETGFYIGLVVLIFHLFEEFPDKFKIPAPIRDMTLPLLSFILYLLIISKGGGNIDFYYTKF